MKHESSVEEYAVTTVLDALRRISDPTQGWAWARPVSWRGTGMALCFEPPHYWKLVPTIRGGQSALIPSPADLLGEWEVIEPRLVNQERTE